MANVNSKNAVPNGKSVNSLPLLLLGIAALQLLLVALWLVLPPAARDGQSMSNSVTYACGTALLGMLGLMRSHIPNAVRRWAVLGAGIGLVSVPIVAVIGSALSAPLLTLTQVMIALLLMLVAALIRPD